MEPLIPLFVALRIPLSGGEREADRRLLLSHLDAHDKGFIPTPLKHVE